MQILITPRDSATYVQECTREEAEAMAAAGPVIVVDGDAHTPWDEWAAKNAAPKRKTKTAAAKPEA